MNPQAGKHEEAIFRTILILGMILFAAIVGQSAWVQFFHAPALNASPLNPRNSTNNN